MAYSHCTRPEPGQVQGTGLAQKETIGHAPVPVSYISVQYIRNH